jgi:hypothetical protein
MVKIWVLEWFCSDQNSFMFENLFYRSETAIEYVLNKYPRKHGYTKEVYSDEDIGLYWSEYYKSPNERKFYYTEPQFQLTLKEVL